jgi:hypothetical protein
MEGVLSARFDQCAVSVALAVMLGLRHLNVLLRLQMRLPVCRERTESESGSPNRRGWCTVADQRSYVYLA